MMGDPWNVARLAAIHRRAELLRQREENRADFQVLRAVLVFFLVLAVLTVIGAVW